MSLQLQPSSVQLGQNEIIIEQAFNRELCCKNKASTLCTETSWEAMENKGMAVTGRAVLLEFTFKN